MSIAAVEEHWLTPDQLHDLVVRARSLAAADLRVLLYYATKAPAGQPVNETATAIGNTLGISTSSSSRAVNRLLGAHWLCVSYEAAGMRFYALGPTALGVADSEPDAVELAAVYQLDELSARRKD
ncbi:hypothetical protein ACFXJO_42670 [Streptomyces lavendulae]|uniref:hypothetical protein n=1 Tax=Streptomyces lavendulae TaxID=1914 RepID=UPI00368581C8